MGRLLGTILGLLALAFIALLAVGLVLGLVSVVVGSIGAALAAVLGAILAPFRWVGGLFGGAAGQGGSPERAGAALARGAGLALRWVFIPDHLDSGFSRLRGMVFVVAMFCGAACLLGFLGLNDDPLYWGRNALFCLLIFAMMLLNRIQRGWQGRQGTGRKGP
ncbi:MAG: hypothetical protein K6A65_02100 [Succinivibrionaceae bacterium]|nr:hypothetical protein [Succinivibrionaceae bacterium]